MKTSKLLLLTFVGLLFSIMAVTIDMLDKDSFILKEQLPTAAKTYLQKHFPNRDVAYAKLKNEIIKTTYEVGYNNGYELEFNSDGMLIDIDY